MSAHKEHQHRFALPRFVTNDNHLVGSYGSSAFVTRSGQLVSRSDVELVSWGLDPRAVGDQVLDAIHNERFYVLTHPEWHPLIEHRMRTVLSGDNPTPMPPPGSESLLRELAALGPKQDRANR